MAVVKLYPPNIAGTLPSFYSPSIGATTLVVPFSMNISVSAARVGGFCLRLKTTATDVVLAELRSTSFNLAAGEVTFILEDTAVKKLVVGNFYKVQIAYYSDSNVVGYYSTTAVIKYTSVPSVSFVGLSPSSVNTLNSQQLIGQYTNIDSTERVYQYQFQVQSQDGEILEDSGWLLHNTQEDVELGSSQDKYIVKYGFIEGDTYTVNYNIITNNGLTIKSSSYEITAAAADTSDPGYCLETQVDYENGGIKILVTPTEKNAFLTGTYILTRASSDQDYKIWDVLNNYKLNLEVTRSNPYVIKDYTVAAGISYQYGLQKYNSKNVFQKKVVSEQVTSYFEDLFLYDGTRQLRVRFNPKVTSFKPTVQETKKTTLGSKYPFILRNGAVNYKELSISGLISYFMDNDEMFMPKAELLSVVGEDFTETTDITDENIALERKFKIAVMDWLNNGGIKLFRSPYEGNFVVRLMNISLSPQESLSRMLHTFSCSAYEVADYSVDVLNNFNLISEVESVQKITSKKTIILNKLISSMSTSNTEDSYREWIKTIDFTSGYACRAVHVSLDDGESVNGIYGTTFSWGEYNFTIDRSGEYSLELDEAIIAPLKLETFAMNAEKGALNNQQGIIELTLEKSAKDSLESLNSTTFGYLFGYSVNGFDEQRNLFECFNNRKIKISSIKSIEFKALPLITFNGTDLDSEWNFLNGAAGGPEFYGNRIIIYNNSDGKYYKHTDNGFEETTYNLIATSQYTTYDLATLKQLSTDELINKCNGELYISSGMAAYIYGTSQIYNYGIEDERIALSRLKNAELIAYRNWCAAVFNFEQVTDLDALNAESKIFTFSDERKFVNIDYTEINNYAQDNIFINAGIDHYCTDTEIQEKYQNYLAALTALDEGLKEEGI